MRLTRLFSLMILLALLLAPVSMLGSHAAMAMPHGSAVTAMNPCDMPDTAPERDQNQAMIDCAIACSAIPAAEALPGPKPGLAPFLFKAAPLLFMHGTRPEADTPPPRFS